VILWTSFYHLMFKANEKAMKRDQIKQTLAKTALLVGEKINFYTRSKRGVAHTVLPVRNPKLAS